MNNVKNLLYSDKTLLMGVLNVTPDSFSDGGNFISVDAALRQAELMVRAGADIIDIGGESSGPGSTDVTIETEIERVIPKITHIRRHFDVAISVDTYKSVVARAAIEAGADIVNDITALRGDEQMASMLGALGTPTIIMYTKDHSARTTIEETRYDDVLDHVRSFLETRLDYGVSEGMDREQFILDPGMGHFVSALHHYSYELIIRLDEFASLGRPILIGVSRKSLLSGPLKGRDEKSHIAEAFAVVSGAKIIRTHDVTGARAMLDHIRS